MNDSQKSKKININGTMLLYNNLPKTIRPTIKNGGKHPAGNKYGNITLPIKAPNLPNIIAIDIVIVL